MQCWSVRLDVPPQTVTGLDATLSADERSRSGRLRFERDRRRFVVAHGVLRDLLGRYVGTGPGEIRFVYNEFGKPELHPEFGSRVNFNLAHSADLAVIAIAEDAGVGVDVECLDGRGESNYADVARSFFSATEVDALNRVPTQLYGNAFLRCWTMKEAYVKARGEGLTMPLTSFAVPITTDPAPAPVRCGPWSLFTLQPAPGYIGAVAVSAPRIYDNTPTIVRTLNCSVNPSAVSSRSITGEMDERTKIDCKQPAECVFSTGPAYEHKWSTPRMKCKAAMITGQSVQAYTALHRLDVLAKPDARVRTLMRRP